MTPIFPAPKPKSSPRKARVTRFNSTIAQPSKDESRAAAKKLREGNPAKRAKRAAKFKARLSRADWKKLRLEVFARDGWQCTAEGKDSPTAPFDLRRCPTMGNEMTGAGLVCDHVRYQRFGHELLDDLRTLCRSCNARLTKELRANHSQGFRKSSSPKKHFGERAE